MKTELHTEEEERGSTDHSQQVTSGRQSAVVRNLHSISGQMRQLRVFYGHLITNTNRTSGETKHGLFFFF